MTKVSFAFDGKQYSGTITCSKKPEPHYYWFMCQDKELSDILGEDVAFICKNNELQPLNYTLAERHPELFREIISLIKQNISTIL
jgi:hypothetical protein